MYPWGDMHSLNLGWFLLQFKDWVEKIQEYLDNGGGTSENLANVIAPVFNAENSYLTGDYVLYNNELYKATEPVPAGTWNPDAWERCLVTEEMGSGSGGVDNVARLMIAGQYSNTYNYQKYAICRYADKLWMCNTNIPTGGEEWEPRHWDEITVGAGLTGLRRSVETLVESINDLQDIVGNGSLTGFSASDLTGAANELKGSLNHLTNPKYIFIGDSYGHASGNNGWIDRVVAELGLSSSDYYDNATGGAGFTKTISFLSLITGLESTITDKQSITNIVVLGGANDTGVDPSDIETAISSFNSYCKTNYPNAKVQIGYIGGCADYTTNVEQYSRTKIGYTLCGNAEYLTNLEYVFQDRSLIGNDKVHPTTTGYQVLGKKIAEALNGGCSVKYRELGVSATFESGFVSVYGGSNYSVLVDNGITQIYRASRFGKYTSDSTKYFSVTNGAQVVIATLPSKLFLASGSYFVLYVPTSVTVHSTINDTTYVLRGVLRIESSSAGENRLVFVPNDSVIGTTGAFASCDWIETDGFSFVCPSMYV